MNKWNVNIKGLKIRSSCLSDNCMDNLLPMNLLNEPSVQNSFFFIFTFLTLYCLISDLSIWWAQILWWNPPSLHPYPLLPPQVLAADLHRATASTTRFLGSTITTRWVGVHIDTNETIRILLFPQLKQMSILEAGARGDRYDQLCTYIYFVMSKNRTVTFI